MKRRKIRNLILFLLVCIAISGVIFGIFFCCGVIGYKDGFYFNTELFKDLKNTWYIYPVFIIIQIVVTILLCFIPGTSALMIAMGIAVFGANWRCFLTCYLGVILSSIGMDFVGRFGGSKIVRWLVGDDDFENGMILIREKGYTYLPFMYLLPLFPDDLLCFCAGVCKMNIIYHIITIITCRGIGVATIVFGISMIPYNDWLPILDHLYDWFVCLGVIVAYILALLKISRTIDKKVTAVMEKHRKNENRLP